MDILSLPDVVLRQLMRTVEIKDRLSLRLTCRALEKLVSDSHAGLVASGCFRHDTQKLVMCFGNGVAESDDGTVHSLDKLIHLRTRLFNRITLGYFAFVIINESFPLDFIPKLLQTATVEEFVFHIRYEHQLERYMQIKRDHFPSSKYSLVVQVNHDNKQLALLPPMEQLKMLSRTPIPSDLFFQLIDSHKDMHFFHDSLQITNRDLSRAIQIISADARERTVKAVLSAQLIRSWLSTYGFTQASKTGDLCGELKVECKGPENSEDYDNEMRLRYRSCSIWIPRFIFKSDEYNEFVSLSNCEYNGPSKRW